MHSMVRLQSAFLLLAVAVVPLQGEDVTATDVDATLVSHLADASPEARKAAAAALGDLRSEGAVRHLLPLLATDPDAGARTAAGYALGHIGSDQATQGLVRALREDGDERVKEAALTALAWIADPAALPALKEAMNGAEGKRKQAVQNAIRNTEDPDFWELGVKRGVREEDVYRLLLRGVDLTSAPAATDEKALPDLFEERPAGSGKYLMRGEVTTVERTGEGIAYCLPAKRVFYVRLEQDRTQPGQRLWYGPFRGTPHEAAQRAGTAAGVPAPAGAP